MSDYYTNYAYILIPLLIIKFTILVWIIYYRCIRARTIIQVPVTVHRVVNGQTVLVPGVATTQNVTGAGGCYGPPRLIRNTQYDYQQFQNEQSVPITLPPPGSYPVQPQPGVHQYPNSEEQQYSAAYPVEPPPGYYAPAMPLPRSKPDENRTVESKQ